MKQPKGYVLLPTLLVIMILYTLTGQLLDSAIRHRDIGRVMHDTPQLQLITHSLPYAMEASLQETLKQGEACIAQKVPQCAGWTEEALDTLYRASAYLYLIDTYVRQDSAGNRLFGLEAMPRLTYRYTFQEGGVPYSGKVHTVLTCNKTARTGDTANEHLEMTQLADYEAITQAFETVCACISTDGEVACESATVQSALAVLESELNTQKTYLLYTIGSVQRGDEPLYYRSSTYTFLALDTQKDTAGKPQVTLQTIYQKEERNP